MTDADKATLLVVDDNEMNRDMLGRRLEKKGYLVLQAAGGRQALSLLAREHVDLVLLDIEMPEMSGMDVLRSIRETHSGAELPVIMATARHDSSDVVEALQAGANDYVTKPLDFPVVLARVEAQLRNRPKAPEAPAATELGPGKVLAGKYRLESLIGSGAFGSVYRALHLGLQNLVAVKLLQTSLSTSAEGLARFQREGIAACRIKHPNAVSVMDFGVAPGGAAFLVMELLEGRSLLEELQQKGRLDPARCAAILSPLCSVLADAHDVGILHRDIKPANVFLQETPRGEVVKVLDFGIAKLMDSETPAEALTLEGGIIGTPSYMAPERFRGGAPDGRSDVYSVGVMLYQMLAGHLPFPTSSSDLLGIAMMHMNREPPRLRDEVPGISARIDEVVLRALAKDPSDRPLARDLAEDFADAVRSAKTAGAVSSTARPPAVDAQAKTIVTPIDISTEDLRAEAARGTGEGRVPTEAGRLPTVSQGPETKSVPRTQMEKAAAPGTLEPRRKEPRSRRRRS